MSSDELTEAQKKHREELRSLLRAIGMGEDGVLDVIKDTAMCRCNVKKSRRVHVGRVIDEAFNLLKEEADSGLWSED